MKILFYGNCQPWAVSELIRHSDVEIKYIQCYSTLLTKKQFDAQIKSADIIITQPIRENFRNKEYLSTDYVIKNSNQNADVVVFPSLWAGNTYYFDAIADQRVERASVTKLTHKHLVDYASSGGTDVSYFNENFVKNKNLLTREQLESNAQDVIGELRERENEAISRYNATFISASYFIEDNWKNNLLFYSVNHGTLHMYQYLAREICKIVGLGLDTIDVEKDPQSHCRLCPRMIVYSCLENIVKFDVNKCLPPSLTLKGRPNVYRTEAYIGSILNILKE